jgi:hypothetical protein
MENRFLCPVVDLAGLAGELLERGKTVRLRVRGWSMSPAIRDGEVVWIAPAQPSRIQPGQVVLYTGAGDRPVIHRVIQRHLCNNELCFSISSDQRVGCSDRIPASRVLGQVTALERGGRRISLLGWRGTMRGLFFLFLRPFRPTIRRLRQQSGKQR